MMEPENIPGGASDPPSLPDEEKSERGLESRSSTPDSMVLAIDEAINILDPPRPRGLQDSFLHMSGIVLPAPLDHPITFQHLEETEEEVPESDRVDEALAQEDGSADVTRFLIK